MNAEDILPVDAEPMVMPGQQAGIVVQPAGDQPPPNPPDADHPQPVEQLFRVVDAMG